jgi:hypothetical protein
MDFVDSDEELGVDDDLDEEDPRVVETHPRIADLTDFLWSIPGFEDYFTDLEDEVQEDVDLDELERDTDFDVDVEGDTVDSVETVLDDRIEDDSVETVPFRGEVDVYSDIGDESGDGWSRVEDDGYSDGGLEEDAHHYDYEDDVHH